MVDGSVDLVTIDMEPIEHPSASVRLEHNRIGSHNHVTPNRVGFLDFTLVLGQNCGIRERGTGVIVTLQTHLAPVGEPRKVI